jgi:hypothetical protein
MLRALLVLLPLVACQDEFSVAPWESPPEDPFAPVPPDFGQAARDWQVPEEVLFAIARTETNFQMVVGEAEFEGQEPAFGLMALRGANLEEGALLAGLDVELVKTQRNANLQAAAALLGAWGREANLAPDDVDGWAELVARYGGLSDPEAAAEYVHYEVYEHLRQGIEVEGYVLPPMKVDPRFPRPARDGDRTGDTSTLWTPSPNYNSRGGASVEFLIIHTCEGSYSGCWSWLTNPSAGVSAHYVVNDRGTEVRRLVDEDNRAWHISATYDCDLNGRVDCGLEGSSMNTISVGIEHAGYGSQSSWDAGLIQRSADLACGITERHNIPRDSYHIVGHGKLQPWNRSDPGAAWPWTDYLNRIKTACGDSGSTPPAGGGGSTPPAGGGSTPGVQFVVDSNNGANVAGKTKVEVSGNWWASSNVSGYWNTGYWVATTESVSDAASFWFYESGSPCYTVEAWWPAASDRANSVTFMGWDAADREVGRSTVNQQINGKKWNKLGDWRFGPGWNRVLLSRWTSADSYVIADAVRLTPSSACL